MDNKKLTIGILFALAIGGVGYLIYNYSKQNAASNTISNPSHLTVPMGATTAAKLKDANPSATDAQVAALLSQLLKSQVAQQKAKSTAATKSSGSGGSTGSGGSSSGGAKPDSNGFVNGVRKNADGSVDKLNPNGTYTETDKDGTVTNYTSNGIPYDPSDKIAFDPKGNMVVQHDNGNGTYTETESDGSSTVYVANTGQQLGEGDVYQDGAIIHDNGNGTYTETESDGTSTNYTSDGVALPDGYVYDTKSGTATDPNTGDVFNPNSSSVADATPTPPADYTQPVDNTSSDMSANDLYNAYS